MSGSAPINENNPTATEPVNQPSSATPQTDSSRFKAGILAVVGFSAALAAYRFFEPSPDGSTGTDAGIEGTLDHTVKQGHRFEDISQTEAQEALRSLPKITQSAGEVVKENLLALLNQKSVTFNNRSNDSAVDAAAISACNRLADIIGVPPTEERTTRVLDHDALHHESWRGKKIEFMSGGTVIGRVSFIASSRGFPSPDSTITSVPENVELTITPDTYDHFRAANILGGESPTRGLFSPLELISVCPQRTQNNNQ